MCMVSMIGDDWRDRFIKQWPQIPTPIQPAPSVSREEFEALRREMLELKQLLLAAKKYDEATGQPDCEMAEKIALIRSVAEMVGVNVDDVFGKPA